MAKGKSKIESVAAREILDSRGRPTLEVDVRLASGAFGRAAAPSGASTGEHEAAELRDGDPARYQGCGVTKAVGNVLGVLAPLVAGKDPEDQAGLDGLMARLDGTPNKSRLGANSILGVSMAVSRAAAAELGLPLYEYLRRAFGLQTGAYLLPTPMFNVINGGRHADSGLDVQEFMVVPAGAGNFREALRLGAEVYAELRKLLAAAEASTAVGDEGGFAPRLRSHEEALGLLTAALRSAGGEGTVSLSLDVAASELFQGGSYRFGGDLLSAPELAGRYKSWLQGYPLISIEDPFDQDDWPAWKSFTAQEGAAIRIIGDDLFATNLSRLERGILEKAANAILIKLNQIGTVTETVRAVLRAQEAGLAVVISHRSGETEDSYIADLAVALNAGAIKAGAPCRSERLAKYNQLLRIEEELGAAARYAGDAAFRPSGLPSGPVRVRNGII